MTVLCEGRHEHHPALALRPRRRAPSLSRRACARFVELEAGQGGCVVARALFGDVGVRLAIGAPRGRLLGMVIGQGMKLVAAGVVLGLAGALALARLVSTLLFEVTPFDPPSYGGTVLTLIVVAVLACWLPARRAMRVDPIAALRVG